MKVYRNIKNFKSGQHTVATTGTFDGMHLGHRVIISRVKEIAHEIMGESVVITFSPHPRLVLHADEKNLFILNTEEEKIKILEDFGIDHLIFIPFTKEFAALPYHLFITNILVDKCHVKKIVTGYDHQFGKNREGDLQGLRQFGNQYGFDVEEVEAQKVGDIAVSSTKIRNALIEGDIQKANSYLGYYYSLYGTVIKGNSIGQTIGFPTANILISYPYKLIPARGVYAVWVEHDGRKYQGMMNIGLRPTINGTEQVIEVNISNFDKQIYSEPLTVYLIEKLRNEIKFSGLEKLKEQLAKDRIIAEKISIQNFKK